ncbi:MAG: sensor histidine kinase [Oscillospiraceae bacterium]
MIKFLCIFAAVCVIAAVVTVVLYRRRTARVMRSLDKMIDKAIDGSFTEENIDETMLSSVEAKLARYLSASELSARNVAAEKEKIKELISDISHQTRTPLANIMLYSELLSEQELPREAKECASSVKEQAEKLSFLIEALVKLSRLETGIFTFAPVSSPLMPMLEEVYSGLLPEAEKKGLVFTLEPTCASAAFDKKWTAEALANIAGNAIKYTDSGSVTISVKEYEMFVCIDIADTGAGIPEEEQGKIFARFYRSPSVAEKEGLGIGLYLAREIISGCGGYIKLSSELNKGTIFSVYLSK